MTAALYVLLVAGGLVWLATPCWHRPLSERGGKISPQHGKGGSPVLPWPRSLSATETGKAVLYTEPRR